MYWPKEKVYFPKKVSFFKRQQHKKMKEKDLHEPLSPYVSSAYNTLCSVTQGVALGALFYVLSSTKQLTCLIYLKCFVVALLIALLWHRYVVHNQFSVWRLGIPDTLIPIAFAIMQVWLALVVPKSITWFSGVLAIISAIGILAYANTIYGFNKKEAEQLFREHYSEEENDFAEALHYEINSFQKSSWKHMLYSTLLMSFLTSINYTNWLSEDNKTYITTFFAVIIIALVFWFDLRWWLNNSRSAQIKKYHW
ncbi:MAG: hypothetical protein A2056_00910 [Deltaproteobacteria bacterium GWA2_42_85]|nr:MAG: hypothetical protein A2056_00910 [Deltaproteobacteria bacterium GWA2_42_85]OGP43300.1 MAG: hypothetical protein A2090_06270 [Deltaproteobacteria bacterium GWD2_42_10]OGP48624.1 MAG: hypothetical protein A2022_08205 [Deltaproteobacteria bacterium GWF2_42_12]OGQ68311.1 MAG: hypothetical protein A3F88_00045 [Deltaproteobacteria bacterium RIFCSPLOWO2_12_FULL_42_16]OGQ75356.1 MAG: hypothetical protein A2235_07085 [Deltaproteobacteria bacterium RIFOXYA2_FULL_42_10]HAG51760.1 hypothetical pro